MFEITKKIWKQLSDTTLFGAPDFNKDTSATVTVDVQYLPNWPYINFHHLRDDTVK